jgi:hypothetical protein
LFGNAVRRVAGLGLIAKVISEDLAEGATLDLCNWFCAGMRGKENILTHYLSNLIGCGNHLEFQIKTNFFTIYKQLLLKLKETKCEQACLNLLDSISWKFGGRDHAMLFQLDVFRVLRFGNGHRKNLIKRAWAR